MYYITLYNSLQHKQLNQFQAVTFIVLASIIQHKTIENEIFNTFFIVFIQAILYNNNENR